MRGITIALLPKSAQAVRNTGRAFEDLMRGPMEQTEEQQSYVESISDETGQFDPRFVLWRKFCADEGVAIDTLPSDLCGEAKEKWEKIKQGQLCSTD